MNLNILKLCVIISVLFFQSCSSISCPPGTYNISTTYNIYGLVAGYQFNGTLLDSSGNSRTLSVTAGAVDYTSAIIPLEGSMAIKLDASDTLKVNIGTTLNLQVILIILYHIHIISIINLSSFFVTCSYVT
jgi:hypothetical protein